MVGDKYLGMLEAMGEVFPEAKYQRCTIPFYMPRDLTLTFLQTKVRKIFDTILVFLFCQNLASLDIQIPRYEGAQVSHEMEIFLCLVADQDHQQIVVRLKVVGLHCLYD